jgi:hypothetical protein
VFTATFYLFIYSLFIYFIIEQFGSSCNACIPNVSILVLVEIFDSVLWVYYYTKYGYPIWTGIDTRRLDEFVMHFE